MSHSIHPLPGEDEESRFASPADAPEKLLSSGFHELLGTAPGDETAALALAFSLAAQAAEEKGKSLCFCASGADAQEHGLLYGHGLRDLGGAAETVLMIGARKEKDLLWVLEEAVTSAAFGAVIGAFGTRERFYGFGPSRRLKLRVAERGVPLLLVRHWTGGGATAAHGRWRVSPAPSRVEGERAGYRLMGPPRLRLALERMGGLPPQQWEMEFDGARGFHMAALLPDRPSRTPDRRRHQAA
jgi:protein ImuA